jgi:hypothetical protein
MYPDSVASATSDSSGLGPAENASPPLDDPDDFVSLDRESSSSRPVGASFVWEDESADNAKPREVGPVSPIVRSSIVDPSPTELDTPVSNGWNPVVASVMTRG